MSLQSTMHRKVGPLPVAAWAGLAAVALLAAYLYHRRAAAAAAMPDGSAGAPQVPTDPSVATLDPTTGLPYAGGSGSGSSATGVPANDGGMGGISAAQEVSDVAAMYASFRDMGLFQPPSAPAQDNSDVIDAIHSLQASLQHPSNHSSPAGGAAKTVVRPSASHGGELWTYRVNSSGGLDALHKAPKGAKATPHPSGKSGTTSGAHSASSKGTSATHSKSSGTTNPKGKPKPKPKPKGHH